MIFPGSYTIIFIHCVVLNWCQWNVCSVARQIWYKLTAILKLSLHSPSIGGASSGTLPSSTAQGRFALIISIWYVVSFPAPLLYCMGQGTCLSYCGNSEKLLWAIDCLSSVAAIICVTEIAFLFTKMVVRASKPAKPSLLLLSNNVSLEYQCVFYNIFPSHTI